MNFENLLLDKYIQNKMDFLFEFNDKDLLGNPSGVTSVDEITEGFFGLTGLTGVPGKGKTTFAIQSVIHNVFNEKNPVIYVSLEVNRDMLISKIISNRIGVPVKNILKGRMDFEQSKKYIKMLDVISKEDNLLILDTKEASFENIEGAIEYMKQKQVKNYGYSKEIMVVLDYLNIFYDYGEDGKKEKDKNDKVSRQMAEFIRIKNETKTNFVIITAKNKQGYKTGELSSIKGPNDLEYGFETIVSLEDVDEDYPVSNFPENPETGFKEVNVLMTVMKNRWGENSRKIPLDFNGKHGVFTQP